MSNLKQIGLAHIQYSADNDDVFSLSAIYGTEVGVPLTTWTDAVYPYTKNYGLYVHPKLRSFDPSTADGYFFRNQTVGVLLRSADRTNVPTGTYFAVANGLLTGGLPSVLVDGPFGIACQIEPNGTRKNAPSLSQTQIENISDVIMVADGGRWDLVMGNTGPDPFGYFGGCVLPARWVCLYSNNNMFSLPHPRKAMRYSGTNANGNYPVGYVMYVATDGHVEAQDWLTGIYEVQNRPSDNVNVFKRMWVGTTK
jgi:hypothetical protein